MTENNRFELTYFDCDYITDHLTHEDYPTVDKDSMFEVVKLLNGLVDENEQLKQFQEKVFDLINDEIHKSEEEYNHAVKNGMPSNSTYENIELLEYLKEELEK